MKVFTPQTLQTAVKQDKTTAVKRLLLPVFLLLSLMSSTLTWGQNNWTGTTSATWLTATNWSAGAAPNATTTEAFFNVNTQAGTNGINMNTITGAQASIGSIHFSSSATTARTFSNSSGTSGGTFTLNGTTINSIANTIIRSNSATTHTIALGSSTGLILGLGNTTDNIIQIDAAGGITISSVISGSNKLTKGGTGGGTLQLTGANTYTGLTTVNGGTLQLNRTGGTTIPVTNNVTISAGTLTISTAQTLNNLTLASGATLNVAAGITLTINGTFSHNGGTINLNSTGVIAYGASGTLSYGGSAQQTLNAAEWPTTNGPVNVVINNAAGFRFNSSRTVAGNFTVTSGDVQNSSGTGTTLTMSGASPTLSVAGSITGTNVGAGNDMNLTYSNTTGTLTVSGAGSLVRFLNATVTNTGATLALSRGFEVMFGTFTENGILQLNSGGFVSSAGSTVQPTYGASSTLVYNTTYGVGNEWTSSSTTAGLGAPNNVTIQNSATVTMPNSTRGMAGNLSIASGNLTLNATSGDLNIAGTWTRAAAATFTPNGRAVFFNGTSTQTISVTGGGTETFSYFIINNTANVQLNSSPATNVTVNAGSGSVVQMLGTGQLDVNGQTFTVSGGGNLALNSAARTITSTAANGSFTVTGGTLTVINGGSLSIGANVTVKLSNGFNPGSGLTTINGTLQINASGFVSTNSPTYGSAAILNYNSGGAYGTGLEWTGGASTSVAVGAGVPSAVTISTASTNVTLGGGRGVPGTVTVNASTTLTLNATSGDLYIGGDLAMNGTLTNNTRAVFFVLGNAQSINTTGTNVTFDYLLIDKTGGTTVTLSKPVIVNNTLTMTAGFISLGTNDLTVGSTASGSSTSYVVTGSTGQMKMVVAGSAKTFTVGNSAYNPITVTNSGTSDTYGFRVADGVVANPINAGYTVSRTWYVTEGTTGGGNLAAVAQYNTADGAGGSYSSGSTVYLGLYNASAWTAYTATHAGANPYTVTSGTNYTNSLATSGTGSYFAIGNSQAFLTTPPVITNPTGGLSSSVNNGTVTNTYVGATITVSGSGFTGVTIVRYGGSGGTSVGSFTVVNDNTITFVVANTSVAGQIYVQNSGGNSTSTESLTNLGYITTVAGSYGSGSTWLGNATPASGANVTIANTLVQLGGITVLPGNVTINSGAELEVSGAATLTASAVINNGTFDLNTGVAPTITVTTFTNGGTMSFTNTGTIRIAAGGTLTNNATFTRVNSTINFLGAGTIDGSSAITFNHLTINTGGLTLTTVPTIDGIFTINGGNVNQSPIYSSASTLLYNVTYGRFLEWGATGAGTIGTTPGYPNNVTINAGTFDMSANSGYGAAALNGTLTINNGATFAFNGFGSAFTAAGGLTIPTGGTLTMNTKSAATTFTGNASITGTFSGNTSGGSAISMGGNLTINSGGVVNLGATNQPMSVTGNITNAAGGTLTLSSAVGGDLNIAGNWSNSGTFNPASREVTFNGSAAAQTLTGATTFDYLKINNTFSTATVTLVNSITVNNQLDLTAGKLVLGTLNCTIGSSGTIINPTATNYVNTNSTGRLIQTVAGSDVFYPVGKSKYNPLTLNNSGGTSDTYGVYVVDATTSPAANDNTKLVNRYWNVNEGTGGAGNLTVTTQWNTSPSEENANFAAGITNKVGLYAGAGPWVTQNAGAIVAGTVASSSKFTSSATFTTDISAGGTFGAGKDNGFIGVPPTITSYTPTSQYRGGTIVLSGSGFTGTTTVTVGGISSAFVVDNDGQITVTIGTGASGSIVVSNPSGNDTYSSPNFTFLGYITTTGASTWPTAASWLGGSVPPTGATITIDHNLSINATILTNPATITINSGKTLTVTNSGLMTVNTSVTNNGTFNFGGTGSFTTPIFTNNNILSWGAAGTLNIAAGGTLTNNGTLTAGTGLVYFNGAGTIDGTTAATFNNITINTGALILATGTAVNGTLRINGGNIDAGGAMPIYTSNSTLFYNLTYGRFKEWDATGIGTIGTTPGYPNHVTVNTGTFTIANGSTTARAMNGLLTVNNGATVSIDANISTLTIGNGITVNSGGVVNHQANTGVVNVTGNVSVTGQWLLNSSSGATTVTGNVTNSGGTISMGTSTAALNVSGDVANTTGTFSMSTAVGGDLYVAGNLSNGGTFNHNSRAVYFNGTTQSVSGSFNTNGASNGFAFVRINNGTVVTLGAAATIINNLTFNSGKIALSTFNLTMVSGATITTPTSTNYVQTNSTGQLRQIVAASNVTFPVGNSAYNPLIVNNSGGTSDTYGVNVLDGALPVANDATYTINRRWQVTEAVSGGNNLTAQAQYNGGEENTNYNIGTVEYLGFYNGTIWSQLGATRTGSDPYVVSAGAFTPANLTTGTQYFGIGRDNGLATAPPTITSFTPTSQYTGGTVVITGTNFVGVTGVTIGAVTVATYTVNSATQITATVPQSGASGSIVVTTGTGSGTLAGFTYLGYITQSGATDWATGASWLGGSVPPTGFAITIADNLTIITAIATPPTTITINSGITLNINNVLGSITASTSITNNGTVTYSVAGALTTPIFTNSGTGTLSWVGSGTLNISAGGTLTNNGTFTRGTGTVVTAGAATINGSNAITFNNLTITTGAVTLSTVPTIDGTLRINGGNISAAPVYTSNSTLQYATTYTRFVEWSAVGVGTIGTTPGYPNNVLVSNSSTFTLLNADAGTARALAGNLTINTGATFTTGAINAIVTVGGNVSATGVLNMSSTNAKLDVAGSVTVGTTLTLSSVSGGDLYLGGNFTNSGSFNPNGRAVFFVGTSQTVSGSIGSTGGTNNFAFVRINNGTNVTLGASAYIVNDLTFNSGKVILSTFNLTLASAATITSATSSNYVQTNSTGQLKRVVAASPVTFPVGNSSYNPIVLTNSGTSDSYGINVVDAAPPAAANAAKTVGRYWTVTEATAGGSNLTPVVLQYNTGEEGGSFNAGTNPYMGLYSATAWTTVTTTLAGANPFTATSTGSGQFPATIPAASYFAIGKDDAFGSGLNDYYRSVTTGNWNSTSTWESSPDNTNWFTATAIPGAGTGTGFVTVRNGHTVTVDYVASPATLTIAAGGTVVGSDDTKQLYIGAAGTGALDIQGTLTLNSTIVTFTPAGWLYCGTMTIGNGGVFNNNCGNAFAPYITAINVQNGGTYNHNAVGSSANGSATDFAGGATTRTFGATSTTNITKWGTTAGASYTALPVTAFGNLTINLNHTSSGSWNQVGNISSIQGDFTVTNTGGATREFRMTSSSALTLNIGGNVIVNGGYLSWVSGAVTPVINITKGLTISSGTYSGNAGNGASVIFVVGGTGDIDISGGTNSFGNTTIASGRLCNIMNTSNVNTATGKTFTISGYTNIAPGAMISGAGTFTLTNSTLSTLGIGSIDGISSSGATGNVQNTGTRTFNGTANYVYTGTANQITGTGLPASVYTLSIANSGGSGNNIVTFTRSGTSTISSAVNPSLILNSGLLNLGSGKNIDISSGGGVSNTGTGDFDATVPASSGTITFKGTGTVSNTVNFYPGVIQGPPSSLGVAYGTTATIRNFLRLDANSFIAANPPSYASGSTLIYNSGGSYQRNAEWAPGTGVVGVPHHVTVQGNTSLAFDFNSASADDRYLTGDLTLGVSGSTGSLTMGAMTKTINVAGNLVLGGTTASSTLTLSSNAGGDIKVGGNWTRNGNGIFAPNGRAVFLNGPSGTQTITAGGGEIFDYLIVDKAAGGVTLANSATVNQILTLSNGIITTSANRVIIASAGSVSRTNGWVAGNLQKSISAAGAVTYETGASDAYRPINFNFNSVSSAGTLNALVSQTSGAYSPLTGSGLDASYVLLRNYKLTNSGLAGNYDATFNFIAGDVQSGSNTATFVVRNTTNAGSSWTNKTIGTRTGTSTQATGITTFSDFVIGNSTTLAITTHPSDVTICQGANTSFTSAASATPALNASAITNIWEVSTNGGGSWAPISNGGVYSGATTGTLTITGATVGMNNYQYRAIFTDISGSVTSNPAILTVTASVATPVFTLGATSTRCQGAGIVTYTATAANSTGITYTLDATSLGAGNTIVGGTGAVTYVAGYTGTSTITASAAGCNGPVVANHVVTITPTVGTPTFTLGASSTRCGGVATITYTASATNTTGITYTLDATSLGAGNSIVGSTGAVTYTAGYVGTSIITASAAGCNGPTTATHTVTVGANTWSGTAGTNWSTAGNWSCGAAPISGQDVIIPNTSNKPALAANTTVGALNLASGAFITIGSNTFAINGVVTGTGTLTGTINSNLDMNGTGTLYFTTGSNSLNDFIVNSTGTVTLGTSVIVAGKLTPTAGTFALGSNNVTLKAGTNAEGVYGTAKTYPATGIVGVVGGTIDYTGGGKFVVERYIPGKRAYRFIASSVTTSTNLRANWMEGTYNAGPGYGTNNNPNPGYGTHITGSATPGDNLDWTLTNNPSLFINDNATQNWAAVYNTNGTLVAGYPYRLFVRGNRSVDLSQNNPTASSTILRETGTILTGNVTLGSVTSSPASLPLLNGTTNAFSYVGNPYAAPVNWHQIYASATNISPTYYAWDANVNVRGAYVSYNAITQLNQFGNFITSKVDSTIQPGQAFFVQTTGASPSLPFTEANKVPLFTAVWRNSSVSAMPKITLQLISGTTGNVLDGAVSIFDNQFPATLGAEDSYKFTNLDESMSIMSNSKLLSIEGRPTAQINDSIPLKVSQYKQNSYLLNVTGINFDPSLVAVIKDKFLNIETPVDLTGGSTQYGFAINTSDPASVATDRFVILFKPASTLPLTITNLKAYQKEKGIQVDWTAQNEISTDHYEVEKSINGQQFEKMHSVKAKLNNSVNEFYGWFDANPNVGNNFYRIKVVDRSGEIKYTRIVKVTIGKVGAGISVYPNPVQGKVMNIQFANLDKGRYSVVLYNDLGEKLFNQTLGHNGGSANYTLNVGQVVSKGSCKMIITNGESEQTLNIIFE